MKRLLPKALVGLILIIGCLVAAPSWAVTNVLLNANFNDKPLGVLIGTGGPSVGEPIYTHPSIEARVQATLLPTPSLNIKHLTGTELQSVVFEFPGQAQIVDGDLRMAFTVRASSIPADFQFRVSEPGNSARDFGRLSFTSTGNIHGTDTAGASLNLRTYAPGEILKVEYIYHLVARTYDVRINNVLLISNRFHGVTAAGVGIGRVTFVTNQTASNQMQTWGIDDLFVTHTRTLLLDADFDDKGVNFPLGTGGAAVGEPTSITNGLSAIVRAAPFTTPSLHFSQTTITTEKIARFELLGASQVRRGELHIGFTVRTPPVFDVFRVRVREPASTGSFGGIEFASDGLIRTLDVLTGNVGFTNYTPDTTYRFKLIYQVAAGTFDIYINDVLNRAGLKHIVADPEKGIGALDFGLTGTTTQEWAIDDLRVEHKPMLLDADFNQQSLNQRIGTGGAASGQPVFVTALLTALHQPSLFFTPALRLSQADFGIAQPAHYEFIQEAKVTGGELRIGMRVLPMNSGDSFTITMSEQGSSVGTFGSLTFLSNGDVRSYDSGGSAVFTTHAAAVEQQFEFRYRFGAGQYDIYVDRVLALANRPIPAGINVGRITASTTATTSGRWIIDDLYAYRVNDSIFKTGFDCDGCE